MRALEKKQKDRFPTAAEMLADLANFADPFTEPGAAGPVAILPDSPMWERRLRRAYADVLANPAAASHAFLMEKILQEAKAELVAAARPRRTD